MSDTTNHCPHCEAYAKQAEADRAQAERDKQDAEAGRYALSVMRRVAMRCCVDPSDSHRRAATVEAMATLHTCDDLQSLLYCLQADFGPYVGDSDYVAEMLPTPEAAIDAARAEQDKKAAQAAEDE